MEGDGGERFVDFIHEMQLEDARRLNDAIYEFNEAFESTMGPLAEATQNGRRKIAISCSKIADTLEMEQQAADLEEEPEIEEAPVVEETIEATPSDGDNAVEGSPELQRLLKKMSAFGDLVNEGRFELAAIILADIQDTLANFDPVKYFPAVFSDYARNLALNVENVWGHLDMRGSPQWDALEVYYRADIEGFLKLNN